ncbi:MAG: phosphomannomutase/phosphoglucomutase [Clostridiales bacterium]|nr:phosphomannomutase/phosphoglucomutase [Clostridiales bacterium]
MDWMSLKSGSDVRGKAVGEGAVITEEVARALGMAFVHRISKEKNKPAQEITIALGRDSRVTGEKLLAATADGIIRTGAGVMDFGMCTTPAMFMCIITPGFEPDGSIMMTASHHPWDRNGLKFFTEKGGIESRDVEELLAEAQTLKPLDAPATGRIERKAFLPVYMEQLADRIRSGLGTKDPQPLKGLHIAVDAGNGAGGFYATMLQNLGANTEGSQFLEPDGMFPNHIPNPENPDAIDSLRKAVMNSGADLGVIFDTDCDRAAVADADGQEINRNRLIALISAILLEKESGLTIVTDSVTSSGLKEFIETRGGTHYRFKRGYRNVIDEAIRLNGEGIRCPLAIETSGHAALQENHFLDDGMYLVTVLIVKAMQMKQAGQTLGSLIADLKEPVESMEIRLNITEKDFRTKGQEAIACVMKAAEENGEWHIAPDNREGIRISFDLDGQKNSGWFLLRLSVHDPVLPVNCESDVAGGVRKMLTELYGALKHLEGIDFSSLEKAL